MARVIPSKTSLPAIVWKKKDPVFCRKCQYYIRDGYDFCAHPKFIKKRRTPVDEFTEYGSCWEINPNNECGNYVERGKKP